MAKKIKKDHIKTEDLHQQTKVELFKLLKKAQAELMKLRMELKIGKLKDVHAPRSKRKEIARIKTIIREKELGEVKE